jgi:hypothetical protein
LSGTPCCVQTQPSDPLSSIFGSSSKYILRDSEGHEETLFLTDFIGSYDMTESNGVAATPNSGRKFDSITNENVLQAEGVSPYMVDVRSDEARGVLSQSPSDPALLGKYGTAVVDPDTGLLDDGTTTISTAVISQDNAQVEIITAKEPVRLDIDFNLAVIKNDITRTLPRIAISAVEWSWRFGAGGGVPNAAINATTKQANFPEINPRNFSHNNDVFIRNTLRMGARAPDLLIDAAGRYVISAGLYVKPTAIDSNGNIQINTDSDARVAYNGIHGIIFGMMKDLLGLEIRPDEIISRRAFGVKGTVTGVTGAGGGTTEYDVIVNNFGIHGAQYGNDGEFTDSYFYDKNITPGSIVWGGDVGKARTQLNRFDGLVATGNSGLWIGGLNYAVEGDSVEEAVTKLDTQLFKASGYYAAEFTPTVTSPGSEKTEVITHNLGSRPVVFVYDKVTLEEIVVAITHTSTDAFTVVYSGETGNKWVVVATTNNQA